MTDAQTDTPDQADLLKTQFIQEMTRQMRALDPYGRSDGLPVAELLEPFVLTRDKKKLLPTIGDPDARVIARVQAYYNAICVLIESECGRMAVPLVHLSHEGFGRALITVGKLVVMDRTLRDVHRFGFPSLSKMKDEADSILAVALDLVGQHSKVAGL